ncbi:MAG: RNA pseudouridine synthase [Isosphaeraceae bacterium]|jgi:23S rRNA pseudouridine1911/1915/1917 synthase|nr:MAG: RNA pseudouridine synthase [Isosphaeraceae bacterium]
MKPESAGVEILLEDNHLLIVNKPAGLLTQGDAGGEPTLVDWAKHYLRVRYHKPGNVYLGLVHRLDRPVSGVLALTRTSKGASRLAEQFRAGTVQKVYWAIVEGRLEEDEGQWTNWLLKDARHNLVEVVDPSHPGARHAGLSYRVLGRERNRSWLELRPLTGRTHQLRVQLASRGYPIVGDRKYGSAVDLLALDGRPRIALHARRLGFNHPTTREWLEPTAAVPADWPGEWLER